MRYALLGILSVLVLMVLPYEEPEPMAYEPAQTTVETPTEAKAEVKQVEQSKHITTGKTVTWRDNPHNCNTKTQYIRADNFKCIDKSVPSTQPTVTGNPTGCEHYRHLVEKYNWNVDTMMYAMQKESGCNPNAVGDNYPIGGVHAPSCGLLQVRTLPGRPSCAQLKDPATNVATAYRIWQGQGYRAWSVLH